MTRRFVTLDVFTDRRFAGNPLAVVLDSEGLDTDAMQRMAREFNLSETVFVMPAERPEARARLRIFTPARELPFAGHPTVGTAVLLSRLDGGGARAFVLDETIGPIACRVQATGTDSGRAEFDVPKLPQQEGGVLEADAMAAALGLSPADLALDSDPAEHWTAGNPFAVVPVRTIDAMRRCTVDLARFDDTFRGSGRAAAFVFCRETTEATNQIHARMFAPAFGILEDPATGSAVAAFAGYLAAHGGYAEGAHLVRIEQGYEMGRPSLIELTITISGGRLARAAIAGSAVVVLQGTL